MTDINKLDLTSSVDRKNTNEIINLLQLGRAEILDAWVESIRVEFEEPESTTDEQLADHMIYIVDAIIDELKSFETDPERSKNLTQGDMLYDEGVIEDKKGGGIRHGKQRAKIHAYNVDKVYWEYALLRKLITQYVQKNRQLDIDHLEIITSVIESCARESLRVFTESIQNVQRKLLSSIVHDIRGPLNIITMTSELAKLAPDKTQLPAHLDKITSSAGRISDMLEDMLSTLSAEAGQGLELIFEEVNLNDFLSSTVLEAHTIYGDRLKLKLPKYEVQAVCDKIILQRVFENLISNAFKYGHKVSDVTVSMMDTETLIVMDVHNFGEAIAEENWSDIFKFLRRFEGQERQQRNSWGIGLAFVRASIEGHNGKVSVSSDSDTGTRFVIELPKNILQKGRKVTAYI